ncbi:MAG: DUF1858 domain-containing protein [Candidatus Omnitrophota bacterium]|nr:MAG: DUF1858 domain-containing protein [Candidatus Omnitrophota bacterium]
MADKIKKEMSLAEIVQKYPETTEVFQKHGLHCIGCPIASFETLEQGAAAHGMDLKVLLEDLNKAIKKKKE